MKTQGIPFRAFRLLTFHLLILSAIGTLSKASDFNGIAITQQAPNLNGTVRGSVQMLNGQGTNLNSSLLIEGDFLVPGTPHIQVNGNPNWQGVLDGNGSATPSGYTITVNQGATLSHLIRRTDPVALSPVSHPPSPTGHRWLWLNPGQQPGDFSTIRFLGLNSHYGNLHLPPGSYAGLTVNTGASMALGTPGATEPAVYHLRRLTINSGGAIHIVGPVRLHIAWCVNINGPGTLGNPNHPEYLQIDLHCGGIHVNSGGGQLHGNIHAPNGNVCINGLVRGNHLATKRLTLNSGATLELLSLTPPEPPKSVRPILEGVRTQSDGSYIAYFGYKNENASDVEIPIGDHNKFHPAPQDRGQSTTFTPGRTPYYPGHAFAIPFTSGNQVWTLEGPDGKRRTATASPHSARLNAPPEVELIEPPADANLTLTNPVTLRALATDPDPSGHTGIAQVIFTANGQPLGQATPLPDDLYEWTGTLPTGEITLTAIATDIEGQSKTSQSILFTIEAPANTAPVAEAQDLTTPEDTPLAIILSAEDAENDPISYAIVTPPSHGTLTGEAPNLTYTPGENFDQTDAFTFTANDGQVDSAEATVHITVTPVNDAPTATTAPVTTNEDVAIEFTLTGDDIEDDNLTFAITESPAKGLITGEAPTFLYTPNPNEIGSDSLTYTVTDEAGLSTSATLAITIHPLNDPPVAVALTEQTDEDNPVTITPAATDAENDELSFEIVTPPTHGTIISSGDTWTYTPAADYYGADTFTYLANDTTEDGPEATVSLTINPVNDAPTAFFDGPLQTDEDQAATLLLGGSDIENDALSYEIIEPPSKGNLSGTAPNLTYTPNPNENGSDHFVFWVQDAPGANSEPLEVPIEIRPVNDPPEAAYQDLLTAQGNSLPIELAGSDLDGDVMEFEIVSPPTHGSLSGTGANRIYAPHASFYGVDQFTYQVRDPAGATAQGTIRIEVQPALQAFSQEIVTPEDQTLAIELEGLGAAQEPLQYILRNIPQFGELTGTAPHFSYQPAQDFHGFDQFSFVVNQNGEESEVATVNIQVTPVNDPPRAIDQALRVNRDTPRDFVLQAEDPDSGDTLSFEVVESPVHGEIEGIAPDLTYLPNPEFTGFDSLRFRVRDTSGLESEARIDFDVVVQNQAPDLQGDLERTILQGIGTIEREDEIEYYANLLELGPELLTVSQLATISPGGGGGESASNLLPVQVDLPGGNGNAIPYRTIIIRPDPASDVRSYLTVATVVAGQQYDLTLQATDPEGDPITYRISTSPQHGALTGETNHYVYQPDPGYLGPERIGFIASDGLVDSDEYVFVLDIIDSGLRVDVGPSIRTLSSTTTELPGAVYSLGPNADQIEVNWQVISGPGEVLFSIENQPDTKAIFETPGSYQLQLSASDGVSQDAALLQVDVVEEWPAPVAFDQEVDVFMLQSSLITLSGQAHGNGPLSYRVLDPPDNGSLSGYLPNLSYISFRGFTGQDELRFEVVDSFGQSDQGRITINVLPIQLPPKAFDASYALLAGEEVTIQLQAQDENQDPLTYRIVTPPRHGTLSGSGDTYLYTPNAGFDGTDEFEFVANDGTSDSLRAEVQLRVYPPLAEELLIIAPSDNQTFTPGRSVRATVRLITPDVVAERLEFQLDAATILQSPAEPVPVVDYTFYFDPPSSNQTIELRAIATLADGRVLESPAVTMRPVGNRPPSSPVVRFVEASQVEAGQSLDFIVESQDPDGDPISLVVRNAPLYGVISGEWPHYTYTAFSDLDGHLEDSFQIAVSDGEFVTSSQTVNIQITAPFEQPSLEWVSPLSESYFQVGETVPLQITTHDPDAQIDSIYFETTNSTLIQTGSPNQLAVDWTPRFAGNFTLRAVAVLRSGQTVSATNRVYVKEIPPLALSLGETNPIIHAGEPAYVTVRAIIARAAYNFGEEATWSLNGQLGGSIYLGRETWGTIITPPLNAGIHRLEVWIDESEPVSLDLVVADPLDALRIQMPEVRFQPVPGPMTIPARAVEHGIDVTASADWQWRQISGPSGATFDSSAKGDLTVDFERSGAYELEARVTLADGTSTWKRVRIDVGASEDVTTPLAADHRGTRFYWSSVQGIEAEESAVKIFSDTPASIEGSYDQYYIDLTELPSIDRATFSRAVSAMVAETISDVFLGPFAWDCDYLPFGGELTAGAPVAVMGPIPSYDPTDSSLIFPDFAIGTTYTIANRPRIITPEDRYPDQPSFGITATRDETTVRITPTEWVDYLITTSDRCGFPGSMPPNVESVFTLREGFALNVALERDREGDLTGSRVEANQPVVVVSTSGRLYEQLLPDSLLGRQFLLTPLPEFWAYATYRIVASTDNTTLTVDGNQVAQLQQGESYDYQAGPAALLQASEPVQVLAVGSDQPTPANNNQFGGAFLALTPKVDALIPETTLLVESHPDLQNAQQFATIIIPADATSDVLLDGNAIESTLFTIVPGSGFAYASLVLQEGLHQLRCDQGLAVVQYAAGLEYGDPLGSGHAASLHIPLETNSELPNFVVTGAARAYPGENVSLRIQALTDQAQVVPNTSFPYAISGAHPNEGYLLSDSDGFFYLQWTGTAVGQDFLRIGGPDEPVVATVDWVAPQGDTPLTVETAGNRLIHVSGEGPYQFQVSASVLGGQGNADFQWDTGSDTVSFLAPNSPRSEVIASATGRYRFEAVASENGFSAGATQEVVLNRVPVIDRIEKHVLGEGTQGVRAIGGQARLEIDAIDRDGVIESVTFSYTIDGGAPTLIQQFDSTSSSGYWNSSYILLDQEGEYELIATVTDELGGSRTVSQTVVVSAFPSLQLTPLGDVVDAGEIFRLDFEVTDIDPEGPFFTLATVRKLNDARFPDFSLGVIEGASGFFEFTPSSLGAYAIDIATTAPSGLSTSSTIQFQTAIGALPQVSLSGLTTAPVGQPYNLEAIASVTPPQQVTRVGFYQLSENGRSFLATDYSAPFTFAYTSETEGSERFLAIAYSDGNKSNESEPFTVTFAPPSYPEVVLSGVRDGQPVPAGTRVSVEASDAESAIVNLNLLVNGTSVRSESNQSTLAYTISEEWNGWIELQAEAVNALGLSTATDPVRVFLERNEISLDPPQGFLAEGESASSIRLRWQLAEDAPSQLLIERRLGEDGEWQELPPKAAAAQSFIDQGLTADTLYSYRIAWLQTNGSRSPYTEVSTARTQPDLGGYIVLDLVEELQSSSLALQTSDVRGWYANTGLPAEPVEPPDWNTAVPIDINDSGEILFQLGSENLYAVWSASGVARLLRDPGFHASSIAEDGAVVGTLHEVVEQEGDLPLYKQEAAQWKPNASAPTPFHEHEPLNYYPRDLSEDAALDATFFIERFVTIGGVDHQTEGVTTGHAKNRSGVVVGSAGFFLLEPYDDGASANYLASAYEHAAYLMPDGQQNEDPRWVSAGVLALMDRFGQPLPGQEAAELFRLPGQFRDINDRGTMVGRAIGFELDGARSSTAVRAVSPLLTPIVEYGSSLTIEALLPLPVPSQFEIPQPQLELHSAALAINALENIVGFSTFGADQNNPNRFQAVLWTPDSNQPTLLPTYSLQDPFLESPQHDGPFPYGFGYAYDISDQNIITGAAKKDYVDYVDPVTGAVTYKVGYLGVLWVPSRNASENNPWTLVDLNQFAPPLELPGSGQIPAWHFGGAVGINSSGQVIGRGLRTRLVDQELVSEIRAYLMIPVAIEPEERDFKLVVPPDPSEPNEITVRVFDADLDLADIPDGAVIEWALEQEGATLENETSTFVNGAASVLVTVEPDFVGSLQLSARLQSIPLSGGQTYRFPNDGLAQAPSTEVTVAQQSPSPTNVTQLSEAGGPRYRKVSLTGRPMPDEKPQAKAETDTQPEETYVDAMTLRLQHQTTDVYVPIAASELALQVRRNYHGHIWSDRHGMLPNENPASPFGTAWSSNLSARIEFVRHIYANTDTDVLRDADYAYVTDEDGSSYRFLILETDTGQTQFVPFPASNQQQDVYRCSLTQSGGGYEFRRKHGRTLLFSATNIELTVPDDRIEQTNLSMQHSYARLQRVSDRTGNSLEYQYTASDSIVPSRIVAIGRPDQFLEIESSNGRVTAVIDPNGNRVDYTYSTPSLPGADPNLTTVSRPPDQDGRRPVTHYQYQFAVEPDDSPRSLTRPQFFFHVDLVGLVDPRGNPWRFEYSFDDSILVFDSGFGDYPKSGVPRNLSRVILPGNHGQARFLNQSLNKLAYRSIDGGPIEVVFDGFRQSAITDAAGNTCVYSFEAPRVVPLNDFDPLIPNSEQNPVRTPHMVAFERTRITSPVGQEIYDFSLEAGMSLVRAVDLYGNTTRFHYDETWSLSEQYPALGSVFYPVGRYSDVTRQVNALGDTRSFTYESRYRLMESVTDEERRRTEYGIDALGRTTSIQQFDQANRLLAHEEILYEDPAFPAFATRRIQRRHPDDPAWAVDLITESISDERGRVATTIRDPDGLALSTQHAYDLNNNRVATTNGRGHTTDFLYDALNRLIQVIHPSTEPGADRARRYLFYNLNSHKIQEVDENLISNIWVYDELNRPVQEVRDMNRNAIVEPQIDLVTTQLYNPVGSVIESINPRGFSTVMQYDAIQRLVSTTDALDQRTTFTYGQNSGGSLFDNSGFKPTRLVDPRGYVTDTVCDALGRPTRISIQYASGKSSVTQTQYDAVGNVLTQTDPLGTVTSTTYDGLNRPVEVVQAVGTPVEATASTRYTLTGFAHETIDPLGRITNVQFDAAGRQIRTLGPWVSDDGTGSPGRPIQEQHFDAADNVIETIDPRGNVMTVTYDARNRPTRTILPPAYDADSDSVVSAVTQTFYDPASRVISVIDPRGFETRTEYDDANRPVRVIAPEVALADGSPIQPVTFTEYDTNGNVIAITDANQHRTHNVYDALDRLVSTTDAENITVTNAYDQVGNRVALTDGKGQRTTFTYDGLNRLIRQTDPAGRETRFTYDALNKTERLDPSGRATEYHYDARHRLSETRYRGRSQDNRSYQYDLIGNLLTVTEPGHTARDVAYTYDALDRVVTETSNGQTHSMRYDLAGNRIRVTYGGTGRTITSQYDALNRLVEMTESGRTTQYQYDLNGNTRGRIHPNNEVIQKSFDALNRAIHLQGFDPAGNAIYHYFYAYDAVGNVTRLEENLADDALDRVVTNQYDAANRLIEERVTGQQPELTIFTYDTAHNRVQRLIEGTANTRTTHYTYNSLNQLVRSDDSIDGLLQYGYDAVGNRIWRIGGGRDETYAYDYENRLVVHVSQQDGPRYFGYDYRTRRVLRDESNLQAGGKATHFVFSGGLSVQEREGSGSGAIDVEYVRGSGMGGGTGGLLYSLRQEVPSFTHYNQRGDVTAKSDAGGSLTYQSTYEAFGLRSAETGTTPDRQKSNTKEEDIPGYANEGFRFRDLETGVFITRDPLGFVDGPNMYTYVRQNPWTMFDPHGLEAHVAIVPSNGGRSVISITIIDKQYLFWGPETVREHYSLIIQPSTTKAEVERFMLQYSPRDTESVLKFAATLIVIAETVQQTARDESEKNQRRELTDEEKKRYRRPSSLRQGTRDEIWERSRAADGVVYDPSTGRPIDPDEPWDAGHKEEYKFSEAQRDAAERGITREEFLEEQNNPNLYRAERRIINQSHEAEAFQPGMPSQTAPNVEEYEPVDR